MHDCDNNFPSVDKPWLKYYTEDELDITIPDMSMYANMYRHASENDSLTAIEYLGLKISYRKFFAKIEKCARALRAIGVKQGDIVSVCLPNIPEALYLLYAINRIGAVANMLDVRCGAPTLEKAIIDADSKVLFFLDSIKDKFINIKTNTSVKDVVAVSPIDSYNSFLRFIIRCKKAELRQAIPNGFLTWSDFIRKEREYDGEIECDACGAADAVIAYTGGTTGEPKGVIGTNNNINAVAEMEFKVGFNQNEHDSIFCQAPPWTYYGICNSINVPLCMGLKVILCPMVVPGDLADNILKYRPNHVVTVPSNLTGLLAEKYKNRDFSFLRSLIVGADKLDESLETEINDFLKSHGATIRVSKGYGMTEVMAAAAYSRLNANEIGSVGIPYPLNTISAFKEIDEGVEECKIGEQGEIAILGPTIMKSYFGEAVSENGTILKRHIDGSVWAHTGDVGYVGEDGRIYIVGRIKRMFTRAGFKIFPATIEKSIMKDKDVSQAAVVSVRDDINGNIIKAFIVLKAASIDRKIVQDRIRNIVSADLYDYELPDIYEFVDNLPLTGMGKVDYRALENA